MPAGTAKKNDPITDAERLTLYKDQLDNIRDLKANQWSISRYGVGAQAAILAVASIIDISDYSDFVTGGIVVILILLVLIAAVGSLSVNHMFQYYITKRREALDVLPPTLLIMYGKASGRNAEHHRKRTVGRANRTSWPLFWPSR